MELVKFLTNIQIDLIDKRFNYEREICITISTNRTREIFETYNTTFEITSFQLFGFNTYPSEFISDNEFVIGYKSINNE